MNDEFEILFAQIRERHAALRNSCDRESMKAHVRTLASNNPAHGVHSTNPDLPQAIHIAYATCGCGAQELIVDGGTQECQFCGALMFRHESAEYQLVRPSGG